MPSIEEYMRAIFLDLAKAAQREDLIPVLRTADLPADRKQEQFDTLKRLKPLPHKVAGLIDARFIGRYKAGNKTMICIHTEGLPSSDQIMLDEILETYGAQQDLLDESTFIFLALNFYGFYKIRGGFLSKDIAENILSVATEEDYEGHQIDDAVKWYEDVSVYSVKDDSVLVYCSEWFISACLAAHVPAYRVRGLPDSLVSDFKNLLTLPNINPENLYYAMTSLHWRQRFIELYKCLEALFYLPWVMRLKTEHGFTADGLAISNMLKSTVRWRQREKESIEELFTLADNTIVKYVDLKNTISFKDIVFDKAESRVFGRRIYKIRNFLVHQEDFEDSTPLEISDDCWPVLVKYLVQIMENLYRIYALDANFSYLVTDT